MLFALSVSMKQIVLAGRMTDHARFTALTPFTSLHSTGVRRTKSLHICIKLNFSRLSRVTGHAHVIVVAGSRQLSLKVYDLRSLCHCVCEHSLSEKFLAASRSPPVSIDVTYALFIR